MVDRAPKWHGERLEAPPGVLQPGVAGGLDGDRDPRLTRVGPWPGPSPPAFMWLLLHPDTGRARRVKVVADYLYEYLRGLDGVFAAAEE